jgi:hypothetical protein
LGCSHRPAESPEVKRPCGRRREAHRSRS